MSLKDQLLKETADLEIESGLNSIFEGVDLDAQLKSDIEIAINAKLKDEVVKLAESHIQAILAKSEVLIEESVEVEKEKIEASLCESIDVMMNHVAAEWLKENKLEVERGIKADLYDSLVENLKDVFVEHNVAVPEESIDAVKELEEELEENKTASASLFKQLHETRTEVAELKRTIVMGKITSGLSENQVARVQELTESIQYDDASFAGKVQAIVNLVGKQTAEPTPLVESNINNTDDEQKANFMVEAVADTDTKTIPGMNLYVQALKH